MSKILEKYKQGDFNYVNSFCLSNKEQILIFFDTKENKSYCLWIKNLYEKDEKVLGSFVLEKKQAQEIIGADPEKIKEIISKYKK